MNIECNKLRESLAEKENEIKILKSKVEAIPETPQIKTVLPEVVTTNPKKKIIKKSNNIVVKEINELNIPIEKSKPVNKMVEVLNEENILFLCFKILNEFRNIFY